MFKPEYLDMSKIVDSAKIVRLFNAVEDHGGKIRFVGGAVRDTLAGLSGFDLDLATDLSPDELVEACENEGLKTVPIGLKYGTIGVVLDNKVLEVTSLRRDVKTDGRHAVVEFTDDWSVDASRRDLTINAVYADLHGNVFDYYDGISDLENHIVRFIGKPEDRIKEDYLRIMRFFRFYSRFGKAPIDKEALNACIKHKEGLRTLSIERVRDELFKLLVTPHVAETMKIIYDNDILGYFLPKSEHLDILERLSRLVEDLNYEGNFLRRLYALYVPNVAQAENIAQALRFTKKQKETFVNWARIEISEENILSPSARLKLIYRYGKQFCIDKLILTVAIHDINAPHLDKVLAEIENTVMPIFPIRGRDVLNHGISDNRKIGEVLDKLESMWIDSDFKLNRDELLAQI
ncbi:MAG: CCA tRNA nucleotidyltransferase [Alphaproteobacteria bacterium]|nr:CCA tRNA nucleotidyltransferase [Alphaproteobacteria bacterium]